MTDSDPSPVADPPTSDLGEDAAAAEPHEPLDEQASSSAAPAAATPAAAVAEKEGAKEWLLGTKSLAEARAKLAARHPEKSRRLLQAHKALSYGDAVLDPASPPREGAGPELSLTLYREALGWLLAARTPHEAAGPPNVAVEALDDATVATLSGGLATLEDVRALAAWDVGAHATLDDEATPHRARTVKRWLRTMIDRATEEERTVARLSLRRAGRLFATTFALVASIAAIVMLISIARRKPDLAKNRPWRASSSVDTCQPEKRQCTGADTGIYFHTKEEESPWVEIDLGKPTAFSRAEIVNRLDCCTDRALPLVIEISNDARSWKEVAKRTESFRTWNATFAPQNARYVRARVARKSILHLERFSVR